MLIDRWHEIESLYHSASAVGPGERPAFLRQACSGDDSLLREVESLLAHDDAAAAFLESGETAGPAPSLEAGARIGPYTVLEFLARGGMGEVYKAVDTRLDRTVAIKFLPSAFAADPEALYRFWREARAASALNHARICTIHDVGEHDGRPYFVMEFLEGQSLRDRIGERPLPAREMVEVSAQICEALEAAHTKGIVHRDIKPANVFVTPGGQAKVLDFGLARLGTGGSEPGTNRSPGGAGDSVTRAGRVMGTLAYLSPEQARGEAVDARSDLYSLGATMFQMATGRPVVQGERTGELIGAILYQRPTHPSASNPAIPAALERIILKALEKNREARYQSAAEMRRDLEKVASTLRRRVPLRAAVAAALVLTALAGLGTWWGVRASRVRWARNEALPRARLLADSGDTNAGLALARQAERYLGRDAEIEKLRHLYGLRIDLHTAPAGAAIYFEDYLTVDAPWEYLGTSPIDDFRIGNGMSRFRAVKPGFETVEFAASDGAEPGTIVMPETAAAGIFPAMVFVPGTGADRRNSPYQTVLPGFWIDKFEVTNREYARFVDAGGYRDSRFWKHPFVKDGRTMPFEQAMVEFKDATGQTGPGGWRNGRYPKGHEDFPVNGVSWYEAAAYAQFAGKDLPTVYHWWRAAELGKPFTYMSQLSNFARNGPAKVGSHAGMSPHGAYDMAGNVREWCLNPVGDHRYILGGGWNDASDMCTVPVHVSPWDRTDENGFRCLRSAEPIPDAALRPMEIVPSNRLTAAPVSDTLFQAYRSIFNHEHTELQAVVESVEDSPNWRREKVSFRAGYGNERVIAYLFLPKNARPPFQTVVNVPGLGAFYSRGPDHMEWPWLLFLTAGGRAVMFPVYRGTYERGGGTNLGDFAWEALERRRGRTVERDQVVFWGKDLSRTVDYLATRPDIDQQRLAYNGFSLGAFWAPVLTQVDPRFKTMVLVAGGLSPWIPVPEIDAVHYLTRNHIPTLLMAGRADYLVPVESHQKPLMRLLAVPPGQKRHVITNSGHAIPAEVAIKETVAWLDRILGPVKLTAAH